MNKHAAKRLRPLLGVMLAFMMLPAASARSGTDELAFVSQRIDTGFRLTHPLLSINLIGDRTKELVAMGVDDSQQKWLAVYQLDPKTQQYHSRLRLALAQALFAFDVSEVDPKRPDQRQHLYFLSSRHLSALVIDDNQLKIEPLVEVVPLVVKSRIEFLSRAHFVKDLNQDGQDDFVVTQFDKTQVFLSSSQEPGYRVQPLAIQPDVLLYDDGARYSSPALYFADMNLDGRQDIVKVGEGEFEVYPMRADGQLARSAIFLPVSQAISGLDWWDRRDAYGEALDQSDLVYRKVERLQDVDGDGIVDMVIRYTKSSGVLDRVNDYEVFLGSASKNGVMFAKQPESVIRSDGTLTGFELVDVDRDGRNEVLVSGFDIGLSQIIGALVSGSIDQGVHLFKMDSSRRFLAKPNTSKEVELSFSLTSGQSGQPVVTLADINGDKREDLLLSDGGDALNLYLGEAGSRLFRRDKQTLKLALPNDGDMLSSDDLNMDGKADLMIKYGRQDKREMQREFVVIITQ